MAPAVAAGCFHEPVDLPFGEVFARSIALHAGHDGGLLHLLPLKAARTALVFHRKCASDDKNCYNYCEKNNR